MHERKFCNSKCEYFPCHKGIKEKDYSCLFCYCPLYAKEQCPGTPTYIVGARGERIKDCSNCIFPHKSENYDAVINALYDITETITVRCSELHEQGLSYLSAYSGFSNMDDEELKRQKNAADMAYQNAFAKSHMYFHIQPFDKAAVQKEGFSFGRQMIPCTVFERIPSSIVKGGYIAAFHAPEANVSDDLLSQYYVENWQTALLDAGRDWLRAYLERKESVRSQCYVTDSIGPGFYGMAIDSIHQLESVMDFSRAGISVTEQGNLHPVKSVVVLYLVLKKPLDFSMSDCLSCIGNDGGCASCGRRK